MPDTYSDTRQLLNLWYHNRKCTYARERHPAYPVKDSFSKSSSTFVGRILLGVFARGLRPLTAPDWFTPEARSSSAAKAALARRFPVDAIGVTPHLPQTHPPTLSLSVGLSAVADCSRLVTVVEITLDKSERL